MLAHYVNCHEECIRLDFSSMGIVIGNLLIGVGQVLGVVINMYIIILFGRVIISWVNADPYNPIVRFLITATEPLLGRIKRHIPLRTSGIDFSPLLLLLVFYFLNAFLVGTLIDIGMKTKLGSM